MSLTGIGRVLLMAVLLVGVVVVGRRVMEASAVADWYAEFALQHLPRQFSSFAPTDTETGAYLFCVRRVVKAATPSSSVETFPERTDENTVALGEGRYLVESYVYEDREDGERIRRQFTCRVRFARGSWALEDLTLGSYARVDPVAEDAARAGGGR